MDKTPATVKRAIAFGKRIGVDYKHAHETEQNALYCTVLKIQLGFDQTREDYEKELFGHVDGYLRRAGGLDAVDEFCHLVYLANAADEAQAHLHHKYNRAVEEGCGQPYENMGAEFLRPF